MYIGLLKKKKKTYVCGNLIDAANDINDVIKWPIL